MNEPKYTPGPYKVQQWSDCYTIFTDHPDYSGRSIADTVGDMPHDEINAQLLAAAPELLEALQNIVGTYNDSERWTQGDEPEPVEIQAARAAIAKATGDAQI